MNDKLHDKRYNFLLTDSDTFPKQQSKVVPSSDELEMEKKKTAVESERHKQEFWETISVFVTSVIQSQLLHRLIIVVCCVLVIAFIYILIIAVFGVTEGAVIGKTYIPYAGQYKIPIGMPVQQAQEIVAYVFFTVLGILAGKYK